MSIIQFLVVSCFSLTDSAATWERNNVELRENYIGLFFVVDTFSNCFRRVFSI